VETDRPYFYFQTSADPRWHDHVVAFPGNQNENFGFIWIAAGRG
jgi:hypothetical protein